MSREKQIEEMAKSMCRLYGTELCGEECADNNSCDVERLSCNLYDAGYRKQEWVSVDERLPEESMTVITCNAEGEVDTDYYGYYSLGFSDKTVTHWMPLPEPPKGE